MSLARLSRFGLLFAAVTLVAATATAQVDVPFTGKWGDARGPLINFPALGDTPCPSVVFNRNFVPPGTTVPGNIPATTPFGGTNPVPQNPNGCVPGIGNLAVTGSSPASFRMAPGFFSQAQPPPGATNQVLALPPAVLSVQTRNGITGPLASPLTPISVGTPSPAPAPSPADWRNFRASAWLTQTGRVGPDFTWCWGVGACGTPGSPATIGAATTPAIVKYRGGPNRFGGTMGLILDQAFGQLALVSGPGVPAGGVIILPLATGTVSVVEGRGYSAYATANIPAGAAYGGYTVTPTSGFIGSVYNFLLTIPPASNFGRGFPWTTGTVFVRKTGTQGGQPDYQTISAMGSDNRTPMGMDGNITLVAGSITQTLLAGNISNTPNISQMRLPEPGAALQAASGVLALFGLQLWRKRRS